MKALKAEHSKLLKAHLLEVNKIKQSKINPKLLSSANSLLKKVVISRQRAHARSVKLGKMNSPMAKKISKLNQVESQGVMQINILLKKMIDIMNPAVAIHKSVETIA